jgi:hypothetical protein
MSEPMSYHALRIAALVGLVAVIPGEPSALAQRSAYYQPQRPTISPYFGYFQPGNVAGLPNYFSFVRPTQQLRSEFRAEQSRISSLQRQIQLRDSGEQRIIIRQSGRRDGAEPARAATFLNYGQFFPPQPAVQQRR